MKRLLLAALSLALTSAVLAGPAVAHGTNGGYLFSMPVVKSPTEKVGLLVVLPGKDVKAKLENDNWAFAAAQNGLALVVLEVNYAQVRQERDVDTLHDRIQAIINEARAEQPAIEGGPAFLGGSSRGGMAAIALALRHPKGYRAIGVACGAMLAMGADDDSSNAKGQSFFLVHGSLDTEVPITYFSRTVNRLSADGGFIETYVHKGAGHNLDTGDYLRIVKWMAGIRALAKPRPSSLARPGAANP